VSFQDVDGLDRVLDFSLGVEGLYREHSVDSHGREKVIVAIMKLSIRLSTFSLGKDANLPMILLDMLVFAALISASRPRESTLTLN
jgi:hypothetical protein